jgi:hypothetical protein
MGASMRGQHALLRQISQKLTLIQGAAPSAAFAWTRRLRSDGFS